MEQHLQFDDVYVYFDLYYCVHHVWFDFADLT